MPRENKFFLPKVLPAWLEISLTSLMILGLAALTLTMSNPNRWQDLLFPAVIGSVLLLVMVYWLIHIRQVDRKLTQERNLLRTLIDNLPDRIMVMDMQGRKTLANLADLRASGGKTMEDVIGLTDLELYPPELAAEYWARDRATLDTGMPIISHEERGLDADGNPVWVLSTKVPLRDEHGNVTGLVGIGRDITERKRAEEALRESEGHIHSLFDNATIGMYRTTPDGRILLSNPAGVHMLGFDSFDEMAKRNLEKDGSDAAYPRSQFRERLENEGTVIGLESTWTKKDGSIIFVSESATAVRDTQGNILYYDGTFEDITRAQTGPGSPAYRRSKLPFPL